MGLPENILYPFISPNWIQINMLVGKIIMGTYAAFAKLLSLIQVCHVAIKSKASPKPPFLAQLLNSLDSLDSW